MIFLYYELVRELKWRWIVGLSYTTYDEEASKSRSLVYDNEVRRGYKYENITSASAWENICRVITSYSIHYTKLYDEKYEKKKAQLEEALRLKERKAERATKTPKKVSNSEARITGAKPYFAKKQKKLSYNFV